MKEDTIIALTLGLLIAELGLCIGLLYHESYLVGYFVTAFSFAYFINWLIKNDWWHGSTIRSDWMVRRL